MTAKDLDEATREELIELALASHRELEQERSQREAAEAQLQWFKKQLFGTKSERRVSPDDPSQLSLGETLDAEPEPVPESASSVRAHARRRTQPKGDAPDDAGLRFDESVPVRRIVVASPELEGLEEGTDYSVISEKRSFRLAQRPAAYEVLEIVRPVVKLAATGELSTSPAPSSVIPGSYADVSLLAGLLIDKFRYHLPLYRQHQRLRAAGIEVSRTSLTNWVHEAGALLAPIVDAQWQSVRESRVLAVDETPIRAGRKGKGKMRTAYFWPIYGDRHEVMFPYGATRGRKHLEAFLKDFEGTLVSDGYDAYAHFAEQRDAVVHALCWAHTRRGFVKAENVEPELVVEALDRIGQLYEIETEIADKGLIGEAKLAMRGERSRPIVVSLFEWLEEQLVAKALLPTNLFTKAARYALERQAGLEVYLADPEVPIDTNHLERTLRPIPMGRKNWLFCWTEIGAERVGQIQSLLQTCVLQNVDPYTYLVDVLQRIDSHSMTEVQKLTPRLWKKHFAEDPIPSMLDGPGSVRG